MPTPIGTRLESAPAKRSMDLREALRSTLRAWLVARDAAVWVLVSGATVPDGGEILDKIEWTDAEDAVKRMNTLRKLAYDFATQLSPHSAESALRSELEALLLVESPKFLLRVEGVEGAF